VLRDQHVARVAIALQRAANLLGQRQSIAHLPAALGQQVVEVWLVISAVFSTRSCG
jgi:hypothetical protein